MTWDPFDDAPADEAQQQPVPATTPGPWGAEETTVETTDSKEKIIVQTNTEGKVVVTLKGGRDFDAPWIVIHADDAGDALGQLEDESMKALIERTKAVAGFFAGGGQAQGGGQQRQSGGQRQGGGRPPRTQGKPAGATQAPNGETRTCDHGQMIYKTGFSERTQKTWAAFDCPKRICDREWVN